MKIMEYLPSRAWKKIPLLLTWVSILLPAFIAAYYVYHATVNIPFFDEWRFVPFVTQWYEGKANWWIIFQPDRHYVVPLQKAIALLSAHFFHWDVRIETGSGLIMLSGIALAFILHIRRLGIYSSVFLTATFLLPITLSIFSLQQNENLLAPWGFSIAGAICFTLLSSYLLTLSDQVIYFLGAILCAILACFSFTNGLLIWPLGLGILLIQKNLRQAFVWSAIAGIFLFIFFKFLYLYIPYTSHKPPVPLTVSLLSQRFFGALGSSLMMDKYIISQGATGVLNETNLLISKIIGAGLFILSLFVLWKIRKHIRDFIIPIVGILFAISSCIMIAYLRANNGVDQSLASRYCIESILFVISIFVIVSQLSLQQKSFLYLKYGLLGIISASMLYSMTVELKMMPFRHDYLQTWANNVHDYSKGSDLTNPHYTKVEIYNYAMQLDKMKLTVFKDKSET